MPGDDAAAGVRGPAAADAFGCDRAANGSALAISPQACRSDLRFRYLTARLHQLGPRPIGELLLEVAAGRDLITALEEDAALDPRTMAIVGARDWPPVPIARVA
jgi:hypothetical protein